MKTVKFLSLALVLMVLVASCDKDDAPIPDVQKVTTGLFVLNEGSFSSNSTTLTYYSFTSNTPSTDFYATANGSGLGNTGNDLLIYGAKMYIVMNVSSYVEVADAVTAKSIKRIPMQAVGSPNRLPRYAIGYQNKVFVSSWDGTVAVIDTASLTIEKFINVGTNPEQMAISGDKLFVANSGGISPSFDSTVSVVNLSTLTETQKIRVGINPNSVAADNAGNIYVGCIGDYGSVAPKLVKLSAATNTVTKSVDTAVGKIRFYDGLLYVTGGYLGSQKIRALNTTDFAQTRANFVTDASVITNPYGLNIDAATGDVYVTDAKDYSSPGEVFCFDKTGKKKFSFSTAPGFNPNTTVLIKQ